MLSVNSQAFRLQSTLSDVHNSADMFSRSAYFNTVMKNERINLLVLSTFRLELNELAIEFPHVFKSAFECVPTLVFHGDKDTFTTTTIENITTIDRKMAFENIQADCESDEEEYQLLHRRRVSQHLHCLKKFSFDNRFTGIYEVLPQWSGGGAIPGVHHPKYMLLYTDRGLHVSISTANLTAQRSADITWCQFFPARTRGVPPSCSESSAHPTFGRVLQDFIRKVRPRVCSLTTTRE